MWQVILPALASLISVLATNKSNSDLMQHQQDYNLDMYNRQRKDGVASTQVAELKKAGINPTALGMGSGSVQAGASVPNALGSSLLPAIDPMQYASNNFLAMMNGLKSDAQTKTENDSREYRLNQLKLQNDAYLQQIEGMGLNNDAQRVALNYTDALYTWQLNNERAKFDLTYSQRASLNKQVERMEYELKNILPSEVQKYVDEHNISVLDQERIVAVIADTYKDIEKKDADINLINENAGTSAQQTKLVEAQTEGQQLENANYQNYIDKYIAYYGAQISKLGADTELTNEQKYWYAFDVTNRHTSKFMGVSLNPWSEGSKIKTQYSVNKSYRPR